MRFAAYVVASLLLAACSGTDLTKTCPTQASTGTAPHCVVTAECVSTNVGVKLDCSGSDGNCVCSENGVTGKTVPFESAFCGSDTASAVRSANDACGWNL